MRLLDPLHASLALLLSSAASAQVPISGPLSDDTTGPLLSGTVYVAAGNISVPASKTLTVQAGAIVKVGGMFTVDGTLDCNGTSGSLAIFTSLADDSAGGDTNGNGPSSGAPGQWVGIRFTSAADASDVQWADVRFAGAGGWSGAHLESCDASFANCTFRSTSGPGMNLTGSSLPTVTGCTFLGNTGLAVAAVPPSAVQAISGNTATGNGLNYVQVLGGTLAGSAAWTPANALGGALVLAGSLTVPASVTLTLGAGLVVKLQGAIVTVDGTLDSNGTPGQPVRLTAYADDEFGGDTNADGASIGSPGAWVGLRFTSASDASSLSSTVVRYAGAGGWSNVHLESADIALDGCVLERCATAPLNLTASSRPTVVGCTLRDSAGVAMAAVPLSAVPGFSGNVASNNAGDFAHVTSTTMSAGLTLEPDDLLGAALVIASSLTVPADLTLTLEPGVILKFQGGILTVVGTLDAQGTSSQPVVFTAYADDAFGGDTNDDGASSGSPGAWNGLRFTAASDASVLRQAIVRFGGAGGWSDVHLESADIVLDDCVLERCAAAPLSLTGSSRPIVTGCTLRDSAGVAMAGVPLMALPGFSGNGASGNGGGNYAHVTNTSITGPLSIQPDDCVGPALVVATSVVVPAGLTLMLESGVILKFQTGNLQVDGTLDAQGSESEPIVLTAFADDEFGGDTNADGASAGTPGAWLGTRFTSASDASVLRDVVVRYGGAGGWSNVHLESADVELSDCVLERCAGAPLSLTGSSKPQVGGCVLRDNAGVAMASVPIDALPGFSGNSASGNVGGNFVHVTVTTPTYDFAILTDQLQGQALVLATSTLIGSARTLTLGPGVIVKFQGGILQVDGTLITQGTAAAEVVITAYADDAFGGDTNLNGPSSGSPGAWVGVRFTGGSDASVLEYTRVRYGGAGGWSNFNLESADVTLRDCVSERSATTGMTLTGSSRPDVRTTLFAENQGWAVDAVPFDALAGFSLNAAAGNGAGDTLRVVSLSATVDVDVRRSQLIGDVLVAMGTGTIPAGRRVTVEAGVTVKLATSGQWVVDGELDLLGTLAYPVSITMLSDDTLGGDTNKDGAASAPTAGSWVGMRLNAGASSCLLRHAQLRWAGSGGWPGLLVESPSTVLDAVRVQKTAARGIELADFASATHLTAWSCAGDGVVVRGGGADVLHVSSVGSGGAGVRRQAPWTGTLVNAIAWSNAGGNYTGFGAGSLRYSNGDATLAGSNGNLNADPLFVDAPAGGLGLLAGSPSIDAGDPATGLDFDGSLRDQGAYFSDPGAVAPSAYCTAKTTSVGCAPFIDWIGVPSASASAPFEVLGNDEINGKVGLLFYGKNGAASIPFQGGLLCVGSPITRTQGQFSGGNPAPDDCSGRYVFDFNAYVQGGTDAALVPGVEVHCQYWGRDLGDPFGSSLSDGLRFVILP